MARLTTSQAHGWHGIAAHPLFATLVPLWFATTFALSALAVSGALVERIVLAIQLDLILPMATPPLGITARMLLAAGFGAIGAGIGWLVVRLLVPAARNTAEASPRSYRSNTPAHANQPARAPIRAHAELGPQGFDDTFADPTFFAAPPPQAPVAVPPVAVALPEAPAPRAARPVGFPPPPVDGPCAAEKIAHAPLDALGHVELIERLAIAMHRREAESHAAPGQTTPLSSAPDGTSMALRSALTNLREVK